MDPITFDELQNRIKTLDEALKPDAAVFADPEKLDAYTDEVFTRLSAALRSYDKRKNTALSDTEYRALKRRKEALARLMPEADERFSKRFPTLSVPAQLIHLNAPCIALTYDELNRQYDFELAAAIWMLDALYDADLYEDAVKLFPTSREELSAVYLPNLSDAVHSDDMLRTMILLIRKGSGMFADTTDELPYRENYLAVLELIGKDAVKNAQERFTAALWNYTESLLSAAERHLDELSSARQNLTAIQSAPFSDMTVSSPDLGEYAERLGEKAEILERFYCFIRTAADNTEDHAELYGDIEPIKISSPYEMCFAFLTLCDSDSDIVWLYNICTGVLLYACQALPWAGAGVVDPDNSKDEIDVDFEYLASLIEKTPDWDDNSENAFLYKKLLPSPLCMPVRRRISVTQLTFLSSGLIPPRRGSSISYTRALLNDAELSKEQRELLYEYFALAYSINHKEPDYSALEEDAEEAAESENSAAEIKRLRTEIKRLKGTIHQFERRNKDTEKLLAESAKKLDAANSELAELRTMIRESCDNEDSEEITVAFPYTAKKRSVIIGGHDSWLKAIKPLLNNVRYISSSEQPNPTLILNSEVVWLQTNALGHSGYYKIIDIVRRNRIKVCYFSYASAEKCAEQFALNDMENDGDPDENTEE